MLRHMRSPPPGPQAPPNILTPANTKNRLVQNVSSAEVEISALLGSVTRWTKELLSDFEFKDYPFTWEKSLKVFPHPRPLHNLKLVSLAIMFLKKSPDGRNITIIISEALWCSAQILQTWPSAHHSLLPADSYTSVKVKPSSEGSSHPMTALLQGFLGAANGRWQVKSNSEGPS